MLKVGFLTVYIVTHVLHMQTPQLLVRGTILTYLHTFVHLRVHLFSVCVVCSTTCVVYAFGIQAYATELYLLVLGI